MTATESTIRDFLVNEVLYDRDLNDLKPEDPLIARGLLDSLSILKTVTYCEERFGITVPDHEVLPDHFESVRAIAALVDRRRAGG